MRQPFDDTPTLGVIPIEQIEFNLRSKDDTPRVLCALQELWMNEPLRMALLLLLQCKIGKQTNQQVGRPGMSYWRIFVFAPLKQALHCDFERLTDMANHHELIRQMLQHDVDAFAKKVYYSTQSVMDNVSLITEEIWAEVNQRVVEFGHEILGISSSDPIETRCDSYVVESHVRFPMDVRLLLDAVLYYLLWAMRAWNVFDLRAHGITGWRQIRHLRDSLKKAYRRVDTAKKYSKRPKAVQNYLQLALDRIRKCDQTLEKLLEVSPDSPRTARLKRASAMAHKLLDQVARRLVQEEKIPPEEKIYSLHAPYTRWIKKGKHGSKEVELGVPVSIVESTSRLIMMWKILWTGEDVDVAVDLARECVESYPNVISMSFDRGFSSADNIEELDTVLDHAVMPKRGTLKQADQERESAPEFSDRRQVHAQVESRINCLEQHGGDRIRTKGGKEGFARTVGAAVVATNLCRIGDVLMKRSQVRKAA